jgi:hypothetical protein
MEIHSASAREALGCRLTVRERRAIRSRQEVRRLEYQEYLLERLVRAAEKASRLSAD